jgi:hypothetical protein
MIFCHKNAICAVLQFCATQTRLNALGAVLQVEALRDGVKGELVDPCGNAMPPCIVMERGESLQEWASRAEPDPFTALSVRPLSSVPSLTSKKKYRHL